MQIVIIVMETLISIHALLAESDLQRNQHQREQKDISIHALLAESDGHVQYCIRAREISIHALLAESDSDQGASNQKARQISIHALLAESDVMDTLILANTMLFLSTLSLRRATNRGHQKHLT